jgi:hypothetical protein
MVDEHNIKTLEKILRKRHRSVRILNVSVREGVVSYRATYYRQMKDQYRIEIELVRYFGMKGWQMDWCTRNTSGLWVVRSSKQLGRILNC